jgi:hypothetical protein
VRNQIHSLEGHFLAAVLMPPPQDGAAVAAAASIIPSNFTQKMML